MTDLRQRIADDLARARRRSESLTIDVLDDAELAAQHSPIMSPLVWDFAHIGNQEELWLVRDAGGREPVRPTSTSCTTPSSTRARTARRCRC